MGDQDPREERADPREVSRVSARIGWVVRGWTGRTWITYHDTLAPTRTIAIRRWAAPLLGRCDGLALYRKKRSEGTIKTVRAFVA